MTQSVAVGLVGATGFTGLELLRILPGHPSMDLVRATSRSQAGKTLGTLYPFVAGSGMEDVEVCEPDYDDLAGACELVFLGVPHRAAMEAAARLRERGVKVVDLSADFRLRERFVYEQWYGCEHVEPELLKQAVYGLVELYREDIRGAGLVANPGCYPTSVLLAMAPLLRLGLVSPEGIVADSKSGATGAGANPNPGTMFCSVADNFRAYNLGGHRHTPEIEQELSVMAGRETVVSFNPHLLPINRGILSTMYCTLARPMDTEEAVAACREFYADDPWVRVRPAGGLPETRHVRGTMYCDVGLVADPRTSRLTAVSVIDNLCRGASGQAVANANLMLGMDERTGLNLAPLAP
jgi:N-acetyl-gamma-glutamyl-phosphate reductase